MSAWLLGAGLALAVAAAAAPLSSPALGEARSTGFEISRPAPT